jgi:hypothetical protein
MKKFRRVNRKQGGKNPQTGSFMKFRSVMMLTIITHHVTVALKMPRDFGGRLKTANFIHDSIAGNTWFPTPNPTLADMAAAITKYEKAATAVKTGAPSAEDKFDVAWHELFTLIKRLQYYVQGICLVNIEQEAEIAHSAGMEIKKFTARSRFVFTVKPSGAGLELSGKIRAKHCAHEWQCSQDPSREAGWYVKLIDTTMQATTFVTGFDPGSVWYFRHRCITRNGPGDWDPVISLRIP